jgi:hypothetical protein
MLEPAHRLRLNFPGFEVTEQQKGLSEERRLRMNLMDRQPVNGNAPRPLF